MQHKIFEYTSKCCGAKATKPACEKTDKHMATLGTWNCTKCGRKCSVNRHNKDTKGEGL